MTIANLPRLCIEPMHPLNPSSERLSLLASSYHRLAGWPLVAAGNALRQALWEAETAIVAHGIGPDPVVFCGNKRAGTVRDGLGLVPTAAISADSRIGTARRTGAAARTGDPPRLHQRLRRGAGVSDRQAFSHQANRSVEPGRRGRRLPRAGGCLRSLTALVRCSVGLPCPRVGVRISAIPERLDNALLRKIKKNIFSFC